MHPDTSRQLAAERLADFNRQADALALAGRRPATGKRRLRLAVPRPFLRARERPIRTHIVLAALIDGGFVLGLALGRWWALLACAAVGVWIGSSEDLEVPGWFLGLAYAAFSALGVAGGILLRRALARR